MNLLDLQNRINVLMSRFVTEVRGLTSVGRNDIALASERVLVPLFQVIYGYKDLELLNTPEDPNTPAIDLGDRIQRISFQVTAERGIDKIKDTLNGFIKYKRYEEFDRVIVYILTERQNTYSMGVINQITQGLFAFDENRDIWDHRTVRKFISNIHDIEHLERISQLLEQHFVDRPAINSLAVTTQLSFDDFLPERLDDEVSRDALVRLISSQFKTDHQAQLISGIAYGGKTTLLAQFARTYRGKVITYFLTSNPLSQQPRNFLHSVCYQMSLILGGSVPKELDSLGVQQLGNLLQSLQIKLREKAGKDGEAYYFVIDGLEWAIEGSPGERIIDLLPDPRAKKIYLLTSCRNTNLGDIPEHFKYRESPVQSFNEHETLQFLADISLSEQKRKEIHQKSGGVPGYLRILKDTFRADPNNELIVFDNLNNLITQQVDRILPTLESTICHALNLLAIAPAPISIEVLAGIVCKDKNILLNGLLASSFVSFDSNQRQFEYVSELLQQELLKRVPQDMIGILTSQLKDYLTANNPDNPLLDLLYRQIKDYRGVQQTLQPEPIWSTINIGGVSRVIQRLQLVSELAQGETDLPGLIKWTLGTAALKSFIDHVIDQDEITALLALGDEKAALRKIYAIPDSPSKIRLLARSYSQITEQGGHVSREAREELSNLVSNLNIHNMTRDLIHEVAADVMLILPDIAIELLDNSQVAIASERRDSNIVIEGDISNSPRDETIAAVMRKANMEGIVRKTLSEQPLTELLKELKPKSTGARELIIRNWCDYHQKDSAIVDAINLWLDTIEADRAYVVKLQNLNQMGKIVADLPIENRRYLIERFKIQRYLALQAPREEWVNLRFTLAEAEFDLNASSVLQEIADIEVEIGQQITSLDELSFALARLLLSLYRLTPSDNARINAVQVRFQEVFSNFLIHSAEQFEVMRQTIGILTEINADYALLIASDLNTRNRRLQGYETVATTLINKRSEYDISAELDESLRWIYVSNDSHYNEIVQYLSEYCSDFPQKINDKNAIVILKHARAIRDNSIRAVSIAHLAVLEHHLKSGRAEDLTKESHTAWQQESDLRVCLVTGYYLVRIYARVDIELAHTL